MAKERFNELEERLIAIFQTAKQRDKEMKKKLGQNTQELWDNDKRCTIHAIDTSEEEEREKETEEIVK